MHEPCKEQGVAIGCEAGIIFVGGRVNTRTHAHRIEGHRIFHAFARIHAGGHNQLGPAQLFVASLGQPHKRGRRLFCLVIVPEGEMAF